jgi:hypothetical protein
MSENRSLDGSGNNVANPTWGKAGEPLLRVTPVGYADGISTLPDRGGTNPREISNRVCKQNNPNPSALNLSDYTWAWGQFLDHELDLTEAAQPEERADISVKHGDPDLPHGGAIPFSRSEFAGGTSVADPRRQPNQLTSYVDGANVYSVSAARSTALRANDGTGRLRVTADPTHGDLLPFNTGGLPNAAPGGSNPADFFLAGDIRANEHAVLTCLHTLFMREHNRLCQDLASDPDLAGDDEALFQKARKIVGGIMQAITYSEFLPAILGASAIPAYSGYDASVNAGVTNVFSTACYRIGHSMLASTLKLGASGGDTLPLRDAFFAPSLITSRGIEPFLAGLYRQRMQEVDTEIVEDVRSFLFGPPSGESLLDLAALNMQRGRDHGLPDYNQCRQAFGLAAKSSFDDITSDNKIRNKLRQIYGEVDNVDPWVGGLAEDHVAGATMGEFFRAVLVDQFTRLRDGDRFWFENDPGLSASEKAAIASTRLSDVVTRNTDLTGVPTDVFHAVS